MRPTGTRCASWGGASSWAWRRHVEQHGDITLWYMIGCGLQSVVMSLPAKWNHGHKDDYDACSTLVTSLPVGVEPWPMENPHMNVATSLPARCSRCPRGDDCNTYISMVMSLPVRESCGPRRLWQHFYHLITSLPVEWSLGPQRTPTSVC